tara:strand:- start:99 stop:407 length:309 start_codon:yes stop_codon:yes gene_type:complete
MEYGGLTKPHGFWEDQERKQLAGVPGYYVDPQNNMLDRMMYYHDKVLAGEKFIFPDTKVECDILLKAMHLVEQTRSKIDAASATRGESSSTAQTTKAAETKS